MASGLASHWRSGAHRTPLADFGQEPMAALRTAIIFGLSYRDRIWASNIYMAIKGPRDTRWLQTNAEVRGEMERKQLIVSVVQAINPVALGGRSTATATMSQPRCSSCSPTTG